MIHRTRFFATASVAAVGVLLLTACGGNGSSTESTSLDPSVDLSQQTIVVSNYEAYMPDDLPERFTAAEKAGMKVAYHASNEEVVAKIAAGNSDIDVAFIGGAYAQALAEQGLLEPIDHSFVPNFKNLYPEADQLAYDPGNKFSVPYAWGTTGLCYRSDLTGYEPTSWNDLLKPREGVSGKTTMLATERWLLLPALKSLGFSANTVDPEELEQAKVVLLDAKKTLLAFDDATFYQRLVSGEASLVAAWDGWCNYGIAEDPNIKFVVPAEGSDLWVDVMVIPKSSKNKEAAHAFVNYVLQADVQSWVVENILYKVPNQAAMDMVPAELFVQYPNLNMSVTELLSQETLVDVGTALRLYTGIASEVAAAN